jgi:hypothetical protein
LYHAVRPRQAITQGIQLLVLNVFDHRGRKPPGGQNRLGYDLLLECFIQLETLVLLRPQAGEEARHEPEISNSTADRNT